MGQKFNELKKKQNKTKSKTQFPLKTYQYLKIWKIPVSASNASTYSCEWIDTPIQMPTQNPYESWISAFTQSAVVCNSCSDVM